MEYGYPVRLRITSGRAAGRLKRHMCLKYKNIHNNYFFLRADINSETSNSGAQANVLLAISVSSFLTATFKTPYAASPISDAKVNACLSG
jgi:hypothetical protein